MHGQMLCGGIVASPVVTKFTDFPRVPSSFEPACPEPIKCYRSTLESRQKSLKFWLFTFARLGCDSSCTRRYQPALSQSWWNCDRFLFFIPIIPDMQYKRHFILYEYFLDRLQDSNSELWLGALCYSMYENYVE